MKNKYPKLFSPLTIRGKTLKNRIVSSPHSGGPNLYQAGDNGYSNLTETACRYFGNIARGGAAIVNTGHLGVDPRYYLGANCELFNFYGEEMIHEHQLPVMHQFCDLIHSFGSLASIELNHPGHFGDPVNPEDPMLGPVDSEITDGRGVTKKIIGIDEEEMNRVADYFANAAYIGKRGGFDIVNIHAAHNWLLGAFFSPIVNTRTDKYGGSVENRARFPKMVLQRVREKVGEDMIISMRFSAIEDLEGGITLEEAAETVKIMQEYADIVQCSAGMIHNEITEGHMFAMQYMERGGNQRLARYIKPHVDCAIETIGGYNDPAMAEKVLAEGGADLVAMARTWIADPEWGIKVKEGREEDIRPCIRCLRCLNYGGPRTGTSVCSVNPTRILPYPLPPVTTDRVKKVAVIGGGPAGMQAAHAIAKNGHDVVLYEKSGKLGGRLEFADYLDFKSDIRDYRKFLETQVCKAENITVKLGVAATPEIVAAEEPDAIVLAVGAEPVKPPIPGADGANVMLGAEIFGHMDEIGDKVVIVGGGQVGCEEAVYFQSIGKQVDVVEMTDELLREAKDTKEERFWTIFFMTHEYDRSRYELENVPEIDRVRIHMNSRCTNITEKGVTICGADGAEKFIEADTVILATGFRRDETLFDQYYGITPDVITAGDCRKVGNICGASSSGYYAAFQI